MESIGNKIKISTEYRLDDMWAVATYTFNDGFMVKRDNSKATRFGKKVPPD